MRKLGAAEAANEIRHTVFNTPDLLSPEEQHHLRYVVSVCDQLGLDHSPESLHKVGMALQKHDIGMHAGQEYPKYAVRDHDKAQKIVHSEQEAHDWENEPVPEPVEPLGKVMDEPSTEQQGLDLTHQVPEHPKLPDHPAGRAPDALTNAAASQTVPVEHEATHDHNPGSAEVHTEDFKPHHEPEPETGKNKGKNKRPE
jgi:hypothetical protein